MNGELYIEGLKDILPDYDQTQPSPFVILQDNAKFHYSREVKDYFADKNIQVIEGFPPYSPDMNPIEHIWAYIKKHKKKETFTTLHDLEEWLDEFIKNIPDQIISDTIHHLQKTFKIVEMNHGQIENYRPL